MKSGTYSFTKKTLRKSIESWCCTQISKFEGKVVGQTGLSEAENSVVVFKFSLKRPSNERSIDHR